MKVRIKQIIHEFKEIDIPEYFERYGTFNKLISNTKFISVNSNRLDEALGLEPSIQVFTIEYQFENLALSKITPISKEKFDLEYLKTEIILNELKNK